MCRLCNTRCRLNRKRTIDVVLTLGTWVRRRSRWLQASSAGNWSVCEGQRLTETQTGSGASEAHINQVTHTHTIIVVVINKEIKYLPQMINFLNKTLICEIRSKFKQILHALPLSILLPSSSSTQQTGSRFHSVGIYKWYICFENATGLWCRMFCLVSFISRSVISELLLKKINSCLFRSYCPFYNKRKSVNIQGEFKLVLQSLLGETKYDISNWFYLPHPKTPL